MFVALWQKLTDNMICRLKKVDENNGDDEFFNKNLVFAYLMIKELNKFGSNSKNEIYLKQRLALNTWVYLF